MIPNDGITFRRGLGNPRLWDDATMGHDATKSSGVHHKDGVLYAYGQPFKRGFTAPNAEIYDLAPTVLCGMGLPIATPCDGRILTELFVTQHQEDKEGKTKRKLQQLRS